MIRDLISINKKSIIALLLSFVILFSIVIPTVIAAEDISSKSIEEQIEYYKKDLLVYENEREITGDIIDFSNKKIYDFDNGDVTYGDLNVNNYQITKQGHNYTIILNDLTAKKIILPIDDADNKETNGIFGAYSGDPRLTNITIILKGENKITGYGIEGTCVKGVKIVGEGNLTIKAWPEPKVEQSRNLNKATDEQLQNPDSIPVEVKLTKYVVPGIRLETGIEKYQSDTNKYTDYNDDNSLVFASKGNITIESPEYYGITNNGDIAFRSGNIKITSKKSAVSGYRIIVGDENNKNDKNFSIELIAQEQAFFEKPTFVRENLITIASKSNSQNTNLVSKTDIENSYKGYRYIKAFTADEENAPVITNIEENKSYCELPRVTVTDDTAIKNITVNGEEITRFSTDSSILKTFYIPDSSKAEKEIVATDVLGNKTTMKITAHITHQLSAPVKENVVEATCRNDGFYTNVYYCTVCNQLIRREKKTIKKKDHNFGEWEKQIGKDVRICVDCGYKEEIKTVIDISKDSVALSQVSYSYDGTEKRPVVTVKSNNKVLANGRDYSVRYSNNINAGTATVTVIGKNDYKGILTANFTITRKNNSIKASNFTKNYSSKAQSFSIGAKQSGNATLKYSSNNKKVTVNNKGKVTIAKGFIGKATITITANATQGYNKATKKITVIVNPPAIAISKLTNKASKKMIITWKKNTAITGYEIQYSTDKKFKKGVKTVNIKKNKTTSTTITKLAKNKKYYVRIRSYKTVSNVKYFSSWTVKNIKIKK